MDICAGFPRPDVSFWARHGNHLQLPLTAPRGGMSPVDGPWAETLLIAAKLDPAEPCIKWIDTFDKAAPTGVTFPGRPGSAAQRRAQGTGNARASVGSLSTRERLRIIELIPVVPKEEFWMR
jgi:hypothetical protein